MSAVGKDPNMKDIDDLSDDAELMTMDTAAMTLMEGSIAKLKEAKLKSGEAQKALAEAKAKNYGTDCSVHEGEGSGVGSAGAAGNKTAKAQDAAACERVADLQRENTRLKREVEVAESAKARLHTLQPSTAGAPK